jgi:hypothetical protein
MNCTRCNYAPLLICMGICVCVYMHCVKMVAFVTYTMFSHANLPYRTGGMKINVNVNDYSRLRAE